MGRSKQTVDPGETKCDRSLGVLLMGGSVCRKIGFILVFNRWPTAVVDGGRRPSSGVVWGHGARHYMSVLVLPVSCTRVRRADGLVRQSPSVGLLRLGLTRG